MRVLDLFSGIGGFSLGLERAGMQTVAFCEIDPFCQKVLKKHWPEVPIYGDVRTIPDEFTGAVDLICGGYPCQPFSQAGKRQGTADDRHLWPAMFACIERYQPAWVIAENVAGHVSMGLDQVLSDLEDAGYSARVFIIPACAVDAPHRRDRVWIAAYNMQSETEWPDSGRLFDKLAGSSKVMADANVKQRDRWSEWSCGWEREPQEALLDARLRGREEAWMSIPESLLGRVAHGIPLRVDRLRALGNAVVPQIPEIIGRAIMESPPTDTAKE